MARYIPLSDILGLRTPEERLRDTALAFAPVLAAVALERPKLLPASDLLECLTLVAADILWAEAAGGLGYPTALNDEQRVANVPCWAY